MAVTHMARSQNTNSAWVSHFPVLRPPARGAELQRLPVPSGYGYPALRQHPLRIGQYQQGTSFCTATSSYTDTGCNHQVLNDGSRDSALLAWYRSSAVTGEVTVLVWLINAYFGIMPKLW